MDAGGTGSLVDEGRGVAARLVAGAQFAGGGLGLDRAGRAEEAILEAMLVHPILVERPVVETPKGVRLCRPAAVVGELL